MNKSVNKEMIRTSGTTCSASGNKFRPKQPEFHHGRLSFGEDGGETGESVKEESDDNSLDLLKQMVVNDDTTSLFTPSETITNDTNNVATGDSDPNKLTRDFVFNIKSTVKIRSNEIEWKDRIWDDATERDMKRRDEEAEERRKKDQKRERRLRDLEEAVEKERLVFANWLRQRKKNKTEINVIVDVEKRKQAQYKKKVDQQEKVVEEENMSNARTLLSIAADSFRIKCDNIYYPTNELQLQQTFRNAIAADSFRIRCKKINNSTIELQRGDSFINTDSCHSLSISESPKKSTVNIPNEFGLAKGSKPNVSEISQDSNPKNNSSTNKSNVSLHQNNTSLPKNDIHPKKISAEYKFSQENEPTQESNISLDTKLEYTNLDVLCERGSRASLHTGTRLYRNMVIKYKEQYQKEDRKMAKCKISEDIVNTIQERGGKFLRREGDKWVPVSNPKLKVSQALRQKP